MKMFAAWYDAEGRVKLVSKNTQNVLGNYTGKVELDERINPNDYYVDLTTFEVINYPSKPTSRAIWDGTLKAWTMSLEEEKQAKKREITEARNKSELQGFNYLGKTFDSAANSVLRINTMVLAAMNTSGVYEMEWTCKDNSVITLNKNQILALPTVMAAQGDNLNKKAKKLKSDIDAATTVAEVLATKWD